jgi:predicted PurR-regulated permease PerM
MGVEEQTSPSWSPVTKVIVGLIALAIIGGVVYSFREALPPLVIAFLIAYLLTPIVNKINRYTRIPRGLVTLLIYLLFIIVVGSAVALLMPALVRQIAALRVDLAAVIETLEAFITREYVIGDYTLNLTEFYVELRKELTSLIRPALGQTLILAMQAVTTFVWVIFISIISFYLIKDGPKFGAQAEQWVPPDLRHDYCRLRNEISRIWRDFFRGQLVVGLVMGTSILVVMGAVGLPNVLVLALLGGALEFLPSLGHAIWVFIAVPIALFRGSLWLPLPNFWFAVLVLILQQILVQIDLNFFIPRFVGRRVNLHPLVVIVGIVVGGILAGVLGVFLAAPIISSLSLVAKYVYCKLLDLPPWPQVRGQPPVESLSAPGWLQAVWSRVEHRVRGESSGGSER